MEETANKSGIKASTVILVAVLVAILFGGGAYAYANNKAEKEKKDLNAQITELQSQVSSAKTTTADWKTYTNPTFGYSIKYPTAWTEKQGRVLDQTSEDQLNEDIEFYNSDNLMLNIAIGYKKTKVGDLDLSSLASEVPPPSKSGLTYSGGVVYKVGSLDGYRRLVVVSDPAFQGLEYITKDSKYVYDMTTFASSESAEIANMLKTFTAN